MSDRLLENKKEMMLDELFGVKRNIQSIGRVLRGSIMGKSATTVYIDEQGRVHMTGVSINAR